jgi:hypothetical protein
MIFFDFGASGLNALLDFCIFDVFGVLIVMDSIIEFAKRMTESTTLD